METSKLRTDSIPIIQPRGTLANVAAIPLLLLYAGFGLWQIWQEPAVQAFQVILVFSSGVLVLLAAEILHRISLLLEEVRHVSTRYGGDWLKLLGTVFQFDRERPLVFFTVASIVGVAAIKYRYPHVFASYIESHITSLVTQLVLNSIILTFLGLRGPCSVELSSLSEKEKLNVGQGMAWSYYFGFLKFILPDLPERIKTSKWSMDPTNQVTVAKLFILLPESCFAYASISDADSKVQHVGKVPFEASRAGNIKRPYPSNVYSVQSPGGVTYYCAVEYATPLLSLYEMSESPEAGLSREEKLRQMQLFYTTLSNILIDMPPCGENCVLVPFKDRASDGSLHPVSTVLIEAIENQLKLQAFGHVM